MMSANAVIKQVLQAGGALSVEDGELVFTGRKDIFDAGLISEIRQHKQAIIRTLTNLPAENTRRPSHNVPAISKLTGQQPRVLSFAQQRLWFIDKLEGGSSQYNIAMAYRLSGRLNVAAFKQTIHSIIARHEVLRTCFSEQAGEPCQLVTQEFTLPLESVDLSGLDEAGQQQQVQRLASAEAQRPFDLSVDLMLRMQLLKLSETEHVVLTTMHHIASDGWSMGVFFQELSQLYQAYCAGRDNPLPPMPVQYSDYAQWQRDWLQGEVLQQQLDYWQQQLAGVPLVHNLWLDKPRPPQQTFTGNVYSQLLDSSLTTGIKALCRRQDVTLFMLLQTAFATLLQRYSNERDIVLGTPISGRTHGDTEALIGFLVNTLAVRTHFDDNASFAAVLQANKQTILDAFAHQHIPFEMLVEELKPERSLSHNPIFQILFALQNNEQSQLQLTDLRMRPMRRGHHIIKFDLEVFAVESEGRLALAWNYNTDLFVESSIVRLADSFSRLLHGMLDNPDRLVSELPLLEAAETEHMLTAWSGRDAWTPSDARITSPGLHQQFEQQALRQPQAVAIRHADQCLTYQALNNRANRLAYSLREHGLQPEQLVGIVLEPGLLRVISQLAVLKAGAAWVPLDPPVAQELAARLPLRLILSTTGLSESLDSASTTIWNLDSEAVEMRLSAQPEHNPDGLIGAGDYLACSLPVSDQQGDWRSIDIEHQQLAALLQESDYPLIDAHTRVISLGGGSPETITFSLLATLLGGGCFEYQPDVNAAALAGAVKSADIILLDMPVFTELANSAAHAFAGCRQLVLSGGRVDAKALRAVLEQAGPEQLWHVTGPAYDADRSRWHQIQRFNPLGLYPISINRQLARQRWHTSVYLLDRCLQPVPVGVTGQVYVAGRWLARDPAVRLEQLTASPFRPGEQLRWTGQWARWRPAPGDGPAQLETVDYQHGQVIIRGQRVSLPEVQARLNELSPVAKALVLAQPDADNRTCLVAYVEPMLPEQDQQALLQELQSALKTRLPAYMLPALMVFIELWPQTADGELDTAALPCALTHGQAVETYLAPDNDLERSLCAIWQDLIGLERVGVEDDFFLLGGHSLLATRLISQIRQQLGVELPLRTLFEQPTVRALATVLAGHADEVLLPPIETCDRGQRLALSFAQQRLWFIDQLEGGSSQYNMPMAYRLHGAFDEPAFRQAVETIIERHEVLRTCFYERSGEAYQLVSEDFSVPLRSIDLTALDAAAQQQEVQRRAAEDAQQVFDLSQDLMLRIQLLKLSAQEHVVLSNMHHIASDGWSMGILFRELSELYAAYSTGQANPLAPLAVQYVDYAQWQRDWLQGEVLAGQLAYWTNQLANIPPVHALPLDRPRPREQSFIGKTHYQVAGPALTTAIKQFCQQQDVTLFMLLQTAFAVLLSRYSNETDIVMGTPLAGRTHTDTEALIGFFVNTLPLRTRVDASASFQQVLKANRQTILDAYTHQHVPFEMLVEELKPERSLRHSPIFQILFVLQNKDQGQPRMGGLELGSVAREHSIIKFDLELGISETDDRLVIGWSYDTDLFLADTIARMAANFQVLLEGIVAQPEATIAALPVLAEAERQQLLRGWNDTTACYPKDQCVHQLFAAQAERTPSALAVYCEGRQLSYGELNEQANRVAHWLLEQGIEPGVMVGIVIERGIELIVGILGVLKAGGVYVPLDPATPAERLRYMADECELRMILSSATLAGQCAATGKPVARLDDADLLAGYAAQNPGMEQTGVTPEDLVYVTYTSGSTGVPKGVPIYHGDFSYHCQNIRDFNALTESDRTIQFASLSVDIAQEQVFIALITGASLYLRGDDIWSAEELFAYVDQHQITVADLPPSYIQVLVDADRDNQQFGRLTCLRLIISGGEAFPYKVLEHWQAHDLFRHCQLMNVYGPSEVTITAAIQRLSPADLERVSIPIGEVLSGRRMYILDAAMQPVPIGVSGELYIGGEGVTSGYIKQPELSRERFIASPFVAGDRLYRTGDLARWLPDGKLAFIGRIDNQVKVRGFRVELSEIESQLAMAKGVRHAAVTVQTNRQQAGDRQLLAYVVPEQHPDSTDQATRNALMADYRAHLKLQLPDYMVPSVFVLLAAMPLLRNGKIDYESLPAPDADALIRKQYSAPRNAIETALCEIWQELLNVEQVGIDDNFFELGGHSLLATRLISQIRQRLELEIPLRVLFEQQTVAALAAVLDAHQEAVVLPPIKTVSRGGRLQLSYAQQRLWFIDQLEGGSTQYNMRMIYRLSGPLNVAALTQAVQTIIERHEVLRTHFNEQDGKVYQVIQQDFSLPLELLDISSMDAAEQQQQVHRQADDEARRAFDLSRDLMLRMRLLKLSETEHVALTTMHHIASDGWSMGLFFQELSALYRAFSEQRDNPLPPLPVQYADYAHWQRDWLQGEVLEQQLNYWLRQLAGIPPVHSLPLDHPRPAQQSFTGKIYSHVIEQPLTAAIDEFCSRQDVTLFMFLQTVFALLLSRYSHARDIVMGTPIAGRTHSDSEALIGFFINTLALRASIDPAASFKTLLASNKQTILDAFTHQHVPFEMLVERLKPERDLACNPICQVKFVLQNIEQRIAGLPDLSLTMIPQQTTAVRFDLDLSVSAANGRLQLSWSYKSDLFEPDSIAEMAANFSALLSSIVTSPEQAVQQLPMLSKDSTRSLLSYGQGERNDELGNIRLHDLFAQQVNHTPDQVAARSQDTSITYQELNAKADRLASYLAEQEIGVGDYVGIYVERSIELLVALLGVMKSGAAYVPLELSNTTERLSYIIQNAALDTVLLTANLLDNIPLSQVDILLLDECVSSADWLDEYAHDHSDVPLPDIAEHVAYVIYTSGSTGTPKGVRITHRGLSDYCGYALGAYYQHGLAGSLVVTSHGFDITVPALYLPLLSGGYVELLPGGDELESLAQTLKQPAAADYLLRMTPMHVSGLLALLDGQPPLPAEHSFVIGGAQLDYALARRLARQFPRAQLYNHYGPTETTVGCSLYPLPADISAAAGPVPIGRPMHNTCLYVLDEQRQLVPRGVAGELYICSQGISAGYISAEALNSASFIISELPGSSGQRIYKTGDMVRWRPDGQLEFIGRTDDQVKIRGFRVELGEIESQLTSHADIKSAAVIAIATDSNDQQLAAYVVPLGITAASVDDLSEAARTAMISSYKHSLGASLPAYMVPALFVLLDSMPLTASGKIDRRSLPRPGESAVLKRRYVAPNNPAEAKLCEIWQQLLGLEQVGVADNFFELGGHSLLATRLVSQIRQQLGVEVPLRTLFEQPTIRTLAAALEVHQDALVVPEIERADRTQRLRLSFAQQRLWFVDHLEGSSSQYNIPMAYHLRGGLDITALRQAVHSIIERHEVLRSHFEASGGETFQMITTAFQTPLESIDLSHLDEPHQQAEVERLATAHAQRIFDLSQDLLLHVQLLKLHDEEHVLLANMHHIASDGWSLGVFFRELKLLYQAFIRAENNPLAPLEVQYTDYAQWQRDWLQGEVLAGELGYWKQQLADLPPVHSLPLDHPRPAAQSFTGRLMQRAVAPALTVEINALCQAQDVTLFMFLQTAFALLVSRYSNTQDVVMGTPIAGRTHTDTEQLIGFFVNMLALRNRFTDDASFADVLAAGKQTILDAFTHQHIPFEMLVEELKPERSLRHSPIFQIMFALRNDERSNLELSGLSLESVRQTYNIAKFDLELAVTEMSGRLILSWNYCSDLFHDETIARLSDSFELLLRQIVDNPDQAVAAYPLVTGAQAQQLAGWNDTRVPAPQLGGVHQLFEQQAAQNPAKTALVFEDIRLSYQTLNTRANQLAHYLSGQGVDAETIVGLCVQRSPEMVIAMLAVMKAGAAYLPIDPDLPNERIDYMLADAGVKVLLTQQSLSDRLAPAGQASDTNPYTLLEVSGAAPDAAGEDNIPPAKAGVSDQSLAYVIYTSGSTGKPKGVALTHAGLINLTVFQARQLGVTDASKVLHFASIGFDSTTLEWVMALAHGGTLYVTSERERLSAELLADYLVARRITHAVLPAALLQHLDIERDYALRMLAVAGEACERETAWKWARKYHLINGYGPTETTVVASAEQILPGRRITIGQPLCNTQAHVLDTYGAQVPVGVIGELYLGGVHLARGYLNRPGLTAERFTPDPFNSSQPGARLYRSGDLVRRVEDGKIEFVGRIDHQVKLRSLRIELGEVESQLQRQPGVHQALVQVLDSELGQQLVAHVRADAGMTQDHLKAALRRQLPNYMVPAVIMLLAEFPLTASGKIDRQALPSPDWSSCRQRYIAPRTATERQLASIYQDLLKQSQVGSEDNFFELGGHSLLTIKLVDTLRQQQAINIQVKDVFECPRLGQLAARIDAQSSLDGADDSSLTALQAHASELKTLYCVPGVGGLSVAFIDLAKAASGAFNVSAFEHRGITGDQPPHASLAETVECFMTELLTQQPSGPYYLAGHSYGGLVAFEMVAALNAAGHEARLILLDSVLFPDMLPERAGESDPVETVQRLELVENIRQQYSRIEQTRHGLSVAEPTADGDGSSATVQLSDREIDSFADKLNQIYTLQTRIAEAYRPDKTIAGDILLLHASQSNAVIPSQDYLAALQTLTPATVSRQSISGNHFSMLVEPSATELAAAIRAFLSIDGIPAFTDNLNQRSLC